MFSFRAKLSDAFKVSDNVEQLFRHLPDFILALQAEIFVFQFLETCRKAADIRQGVEQIEQFERGFGTALFAIEGADAADRERGFQIEQILTQLIAGRQRLIQAVGAAGFFVRKRRLLPCLG